MKELSPTRTALLCNQDIIWQNLAPRQYCQIFHKNALVGVFCYQYVRRIKHSNLCPTMKAVFGLEQLIQTSLNNGLNLYDLNLFPRLEIYA